MLANNGSRSQIVVIQETFNIISDYQYDHSFQYDDTDTVGSAYVPLPAAFWFMGTGLFILMNMVKKRK